MIKEDTMVLSLPSRADILADIVLQPVSRRFVSRSLVVSIAEQELSKGRSE